MQVKKSVAATVFVLEWKAQDGDFDTQVEMALEPLGAQKGEVSISESGRRSTPKAVESSCGSCRVWTHILCCLKTCLEYGMTLREYPFRAAS